MLLIMLSLINVITCSTNYFIFTPIDHQHCKSRIKSMVMNKLTVDHGSLSIKIEPNMSSMSFTEDYSLCPITIVKPSGKLTKESFTNLREVIYWNLAMKIYGELSSCTTFIGYGSLDNDLMNSVVYTEKYGKKLSCRSQMPEIFQSQKNHIAIWWVWSKDVLPKLKIDIVSYMRFVGTFTVKEKEKICADRNGFWCGEFCIDGRLRCDGNPDCIIFSKSIGDSIDEFNCTGYKRNIGSIKAASNHQSFWISNIFYIILIIVGIILLISASKIFVTNFVASKNLRKKNKSSTLNSPLYSLSLGESDNESAYEDIRKCSDTDSKKNSSLIISGDEETQEEILGTSKEYIDSVYNNNVFHPQLVAPKKQNETKKNHTLPGPVELHSLSSYQLHDCPSESTTSTNISLTGTMLFQGQNAISEMNSPGSSRTFRRIFNKNLNKTSSYDKILISNDASSSTSHDADSIKTTPSNVKPKSYTIPRLEANNFPNSDYDNDNFTAYVII